MAEGAWLATLDSAKRVTAVGRGCMIDMVVESSVCSMRSAGLLARVARGAWAVRKWDDDRFRRGVSRLPSGALRVMFRFPPLGRASRERI